MQPDSSVGVIISCLSEETIKQIAINCVEDAERDKSKS